MPIEKDDGFQLIKGGQPFTTFLNSSFEIIKNPVAIAIWLYLCSKPKDWTIRSADIMSRFDIGDYQYRAAMKELRDCSLVWDAIVRDGQGKIIKKSIFCGYAPDDQGKIGQGKKTHTVDYPQHGLTHNVGEPQRGKSTPLVIKEESLQIKDNLQMRESARVGKYAISIDWKPDQTTLAAVCLRKGVGQEKITQELITDFALYWSAQDQVQAEQVWASKLCDQARRQQTKLAGDHRGAHQHPNQPRPDNSAAGRVRANIARAQSERAAVAAVNRGFVGENDGDVRPQVGEQLRRRDRSGSDLGGVIEGDFARTD